MKVLVAEDDPVVLHLLERLLAVEYEVVTARDGAEAWEALRRDDGPRLAVLDWQMPGMQGTDICRKARQLPDTPMYLLLITATRKSGADVLAGFDAGADDYITKPFDADELRARIAVGRRVLQLQQALAEHVAELQEALACVRRLEGLLPICSWCKRIRNDQNYWEQLETYLAEHSDATVTHGICPQCCEKLRAEGKWIVHQR
ncbi:MAG: response regulator transcription factor [Acidobacteriia bacterium]|nr:response regulator transcription factor [Terriglobia bacterium]